MIIKMWQNDINKKSLKKSNVCIDVLICMWADKTLKYQVNLQWVDPSNSSCPYMNRV